MSQTFIKTNQKVKRNKLKKTGQHAYIWKQNFLQFYATLFEKSYRKILKFKIYKLYTVGK